MLPISHAAHGGCRHRAQDVIDGQLTPIAIAPLGRDRNAIGFGRERAVASGRYTRPKCWRDC
jgi:hypothetical protein